MKLADYLNNPEKSLELLKKTQQYFIDQIKLTPVLAIELEFFIVPEKGSFLQKQEEEIVSSIKTIAKNHGIKIEDAFKEVGEFQFEVNFERSDDLVKLASDVREIKKVITHIALSRDAEAIFTAKPFQEKEVGNGMHVHISLWDMERNVFEKEGEENPRVFLNSVAGLLDLMRDSIGFFISGEEDLKRYHSRFELSDSEKRYKTSATNAPINVSWGPNNRTTALRIPQATQEPDKRRIEHRVPASSADAALCMVAILIGVMHGIEMDLDPIERVWGNAFDPQYGDLKPLVDEENEDFLNLDRMDKFLERIL